MKKFLCLFFLLLATVADAQSEEDLDRQFLGDGEKTPVAEKKSPWEIGAYLQAVYQQAVPFVKDSSEYQVIKIEGRGHLDIQWKYDIFSAKAVVDAFYYPWRHFEKRGRENRIELPELYFEAGEKLQVKAGVQKFTWGSCELFRLTRYFTRYDLSEFLAREQEDLARGVGALSVKYLFGDFSVEAVWSPVHSPIIMPRGFWELEDELPYESELYYSNAVDYDLGKSSAGLRLGGTFKGVDMFLSYYNGMTLSPVFDSALVATGLVNSEPIELRYPKVIEENRILYSRINSIGFELSTVIKKFTLKFETVFTPDMTTSEELFDDDMEDIILSLAPGNSTTSLTEIVRAPYMEFAIGGDMNLWGRYGTLLFEWTQGFFLKNTLEYSYPATSYLLLLLLRDSFLDKRLTVQGGTLLRPISLTPGGLFIGEVGWKFTARLSGNFRGMFFLGNDDDLFSYFEDKHLLEVKIRYTL